MKKKNILVYRNINNFKVLILFLFLNLFFISMLQAQTCGTPENVIESNKLQNKNGNSNPCETGCEYNHSITTVCINVFFVIVRETDQSGGFNPSNIGQIVDNLNDAFNPHNIYIHNNGHDFIDDSNYYDIDSLQEYDAMIAELNMSNSINFYLVNSGTYPGHAREVLSKYLYVENTWALSAVSPHEVGHCLSLYHTHQGRLCSDGGCAEDIVCSQYSNCCECGDMVCDTPADPCLNGNLNSNCQYTGGGGFNPDTSNFMAAGNNQNCRDHFTEGQAERMKYHIENYQVLQDVVGTSCAIPEITGDDTLCNNDQKTYTLTNNSNQVDWEVGPSNLIEEVTSNNTSITIKRTSSSATGYGYIKALLPQTIIKDSIWVGRDPQLTIAKLDDGTYLIHGYPNDVCENEQITTDISVSGADTVTWTKVSSSHTTTWSQQGINVSFYLWAPNHTATFRLTLTNQCGTFTRDYVFNIKDCNVGGDPCLSSFTVSQNPVDTEIEIINIPAPCDLSKTLNKDKNIKNSTATLYDLFGNQMVSKQPSVGKMNVQNLKSGLYILIITYNGKNTNFRILVK